MFNTPILFITHSNPKVTKKTFEQILKIKPSKLYVFSDGYYNLSNDKINEIIEVRNLINSFSKKCHIKKKFQKKNLGIKLAVKKAIDWFFINENKGIILEYDCYPKLYFFEFCEIFLKKHYNDLDIYSITGSNYYKNTTKIKHDIFFSSFTNPWGWATWRRSWKLYKNKISNYDLHKIVTKIKNTYDFPYRNFLIKNYQAHSKNKNSSSWSFNFNYDQILNNKLTIVPKKNLIKNIGFKEQSANTSFLHSFFFGKQLLSNFKVKDLPKIKEINYEIDNYILKVCYLYMNLTIIFRRIINIFK
jgi:hypothetical protein